ncbi:MAG: LytTR family DNA-binding domain-containing protein [Saprospiraceae bacterium]
MTTFLIDDEPYSTDVLRIMLEKYCPDIVVTGVYNDPVLALENLQNNPPNLVFLDIEMPRLNGFDLLRQCPQPPFSVIFTTAYDQYAVRAFKFNAVDYLLKPVDKDELIQAVEKVTKNNVPNAQQLDALSLLHKHPTPERIALPVGHELLFVNVADLLYMESDGAYVSVYLVGQNKPVLLAKSLREFVELLNNPQFFRVHNSYLVNMRHIQKIIRTDGGEVVMANGRSLPVARAKKQELMSRIAKV